MLFFKKRNQVSVLMPLWDYCILELPEDKKSMIIKPDSTDPAKVGTLELVVLFTGPDCRNIKPGDRLVFNPQAAVIFAHEGHTYYLISERATGVVVANLRTMYESEDERMPA